MNWKIGCKQYRRLSHSVIFILRMCLYLLTYKDVLRVI